MARLVVLPDGRVEIAQAIATGVARVLEGHTFPVRAVAVLADGRVVSGSDDKTVRVWNTETGAAQVLEGHTDWVMALAVLPDGRVVSGSRDSSVRVWSRNFEHQHSFVADGPISCLSVSPAGVIAAGCQDGTVHLLRLPPEGPMAV